MSLARALAGRGLRRGEARLEKLLNSAEHGVRASMRPGIEGVITSRRFWAQSGTQKRSAYVYVVYRRAFVSLYRVHKGVCHSA